MQARDIQCDISLDKCRTESVRLRLDTLHTNHRALFPWEVLPAGFLGVPILAYFEQAAASVSNQRNAF